MTGFRVSGIGEDLADQARRTHRSPQYGHPAHREVATGTGPCRVCLRTFEVGREERLLFTYQPFLTAGSLPAPGPIFVHAEPCVRHDGFEPTPDLRSLPTIVEGYGDRGWLRVQEAVEDRALEEVLARAFAVEGVAFVHLRNAEAGCFMARVDRVTVD